MRESIGGTWIMQLVIVFMLIFVAFLALSLNYSKAFQMKNDITTMIEKKEGLTSGDNGSIALINNYLQTHGYSIKKSCPEGSYGVGDLTVNSAEEVIKGNNRQYYYCVTKIKSKTANHDGRSYYKVNIFFYFNLPVVGDIMKFNISGNTNDVIIPADDLKAIEG